MACRRALRVAVTHPAAKIQMSPVTICHFSTPVADLTLRVCALPAVYKVLKQVHPVRAPPVLPRDAFNAICRLLPIAQRTGLEWRIGCLYLRA